MFKEEFEEHKVNFFSVYTAKKGGVNGFEKWRV
jgi:hypothetical protein